MFQLNWSWALVWGGCRWLLRLPWKVGPPAWAHLPHPVPPTPQSPTSHGSRVTFTSPGDRRSILPWFGRAGVHSPHVPVSPASALMSCIPIRGGLSSLTAKDALTNGPRQPHVDSSDASPVLLLLLPRSSWTGRGSLPVPTHGGLSPGLSRAGGLVPCLMQAQSCEQSYHRGEPVIPWETLLQWPWRWAAFCKHLPVVENLIWSRQGHMAASPSSAATPFPPYSLWSCLAIVLPASDSSPRRGNIQDEPQPSGRAPGSRQRTGGCPRRLTEFHLLCRAL